MKASEVIQHLSSIIDTYGDLDVIINWNPYFSLGNIEDFDIKEGEHCDSDGQFRHKTRIVINS